MTDQMDIAFSGKKSALGRLLGALAGVSKTTIKTAGASA